jgi:hypothetical protein
MDPFDKKINQMKYNISEIDKEIKEIQKVSIITYMLKYKFYWIRKTELQKKTYQEK